MIGKFANRVAAQFGCEIRRVQPEIVTTPVNPRTIPIRPWENDKSFTDLMDDGVWGRTLVSADRCYILYKLAKQAAHTPGEVAEIGVYKGGTARLMAKTLSESGKVIHLFDTFEGMPVTDADRDLHRKGDFADTSLESVMAYLADTPNTAFHQGLFPDTADPIRSLTFSLVHVDVDIYTSVLSCCEFFYPRLAPGGIMIFDDYGFPSCPGAKQAVDEFFSALPEEPVYVPTAQCLVVKAMPA